MYFFMILDMDYYDGKFYILKEDIEVLDFIMVMVEIFNVFNIVMFLILFLEKIFLVEGEWYEVEGFFKNKFGEIFEYINIGVVLVVVVLEMVIGEFFNVFVIKYIL